MWKKVVWCEWKNVAADYTALIILTVFGLAIFYAVISNSESVRKQHEAVLQYQKLDEEKLDRFRRRTAEMERFAASNNSIERLPRYEREEFEYGPRDARYVAAHNPLNAVLPPAPLGFLAVGHSDLTSVSHYVSWYDYEMIPNAEPTENPLKLTIGNFDLAFVVLYLFPLLIIVLSFDLFASERDDGRLRLLLSQPITITTLLVGKIGLRILLVFGSTIVFIASAWLLSSPVSLTSPDIAMRLGGWLGVILCYGLFWFALAVFINGLGKAAATNAIILAGFWLLFVFLLPSVLNLLSATIFPVPSKSVLIDAKRDIPKEVEKLDMNELRNSFFKNNPQYSKDLKYTDWGKYGVETLAKNEESFRRLQIEKNKLNRQLDHQLRSLDYLQIVSPSIPAQNILYEFSGVSLTRYRSYEAQAEQFNAQWKNYFLPKFFGESEFTSTDYEQIPRFQFVEQSIDTIVSRVLFSWLNLLIPCVVVAFFAFRSLRGFQIVG